MLRGSGFVLLLAAAFGVACSDDREFTDPDVAGASGTRAGSGGSPTGSGGRNPASGRGGSAGASGAAVAGDTSAGRSTGGSSESGGTGPDVAGRGNDAGGGSGDDGSGGTDGSGATSGSDGNGGSSASGSGADGGSSGSSAVGGSSGTDAGGTGATSGTDAGGTSSGGTGTGGGGTPNTAGTSASGSGGQSSACDSQLLANADFDAGPTPSWLQESNVAGVQAIIGRTDAALVAEQVTPHSGDFLAWLGGFEDDEFDHRVITMRQEVTIPAEANTLTLSGRYWIKTEDEADDIYDVSYLEFEDAEGLVWQARAYSNQDATSDWTSFERSTTDLDRLAGKTVTFLAYARVDFYGKTSFFYDTLRLEASCGR